MPEDDQNIDELIERSSLGGPGAGDLRRRTPAFQVDVARSGTSLGDSTTELPRRPGDRISHRVSADRIPKISGDPAEDGSSAARIALATPPVAPPGGSDSLRGRGPGAQDPALAPVVATLRAMFGTSTQIPGLAPDLLVRDDAEWIPASRLATDHLTFLVERAARRWRAQPHAAVALAWKAYTYWLALPAVLGFSVARRVPLLTSEDVLVHFDDPRPLVSLGLREDIAVAVLPSDPLALRGDRTGIIVVADEVELLRLFRRSLLDEHLTPLLDALHLRVRLGSRTLLGSVAAGVAHAVLRAADAVPGPSDETIHTLLNALGIDDLIELVPGPDGRIDVQRRTCCLAFTLPVPKVCRGCCIK